jgi:Ca-activated chloride channel family protein
MTFAHPQMLWFLLVLPPAMLAFFWWASRARQRLWTQFIHARLLPALTVGISPARQRIRMACLIAAVVCFILALARPQWGFDWEEVNQRGLDIVVAIDTSKSMLAEDIAPNRLARAKLAALDLMQQAKSDRLGLVAFAGTAFLQCPLTIDDTAFRQSVESLDVNIIPQGGTALSEAIDTALSAFKEGDNHKALVLFTDGEDQDSGALETAKAAAQAGLQIFTIGIGSPEGELLRIKDAKGRTDYIRDDQGNVVKSHLNEDLLRKIAGATPRGFYLPLRGAKTIDTLYQQGLDPLPKSDASEKLVRRYHERYQWPLAAALLLLLIEMFFPERKRAARTKPAAPASARPALSPALALVLLLLVPSRLFGSPSSALREYKEGKYDQSLKEYEQLLERKKDDPRLHFNAGTAAYRNRKFDEAAKQFDEALASPDLKLQEQAYYNRGNTLFYLGESNPDPANRTKAWEEAVQNFESTMKLNPQDADAKFNHDYVKKKLEELKQQQKQNQKQDKQDKDQDKKENQDQKQDQQKQDSKKDQDQKSQQDQNKSDQKQDSKDQQSQQQKQQEQQQQAKNEKSQEQKQREQQQKQQEQQKQEANKSSGKDKEKSSDEQPGAEDLQKYAAGQMTPQQARQLLDAQKGEEMLLPVKPNGKPVDPRKPIRDW